MRRQTQICEGYTLDALLASGELTPPRALRFAREIAEQLRLAHEHGVCHGALTTDDIVIVGEHAVVEGFDAITGWYPEADIRAFGSILERLLPGHRVARECASAYASERPDSFELIVEELQGFSAFRTWVGSVLIGAFTVSLLYYERLF